MKELNKAIEDKNVSQVSKLLIDGVAEGNELEILEKAIKNQADNNNSFHISFLNKDQKILYEIYKTLFEGRESQFQINNRNFIFDLIDKYNFSKLGMLTEFFWAKESGLYDPVNKEYLDEVLYKKSLEDENININYKSAFDNLYRNLNDQKIPAYNSFFFDQIKFFNEINKTDPKWFLKSAKELAAKYLTKENNNHGNFRYFKNELSQDRIINFYNLIDLQRFYKDYVGKKFLELVNEEIFNKKRPNLDFFDNTINHYLHSTYTNRITPAPFFSLPLENGKTIPFMVLEKHYEAMNYNNKEGAEYYRKILMKLVNLGIDLNDLTCEGKSILSLAIANNDNTMAKILISHNAFIGNEISNKTTLTAKDFTNLMNGELNLPKCDINENIDLYFTPKEDGEVLFAINPETSIKNMQKVSMNNEDYLRLISLHKVYNEKIITKKLVDNINAFSKQCDIYGIDCRKEKILGLKQSIMSYFISANFFNFLDIDLLVNSMKTAHENLIYENTFKAHGKEFKPEMYKLEREELNNLLLKGNFEAKEWALTGQKVYDVNKIKASHAEFLARGIPMESSVSKHFNNLINLKYTYDLGRVIYRMGSNFVNYFLEVGKNVVSEKVDENEAKAEIKIVQGQLEHFLTNLSLLRDKSNSIILFKKKELEKAEKENTPELKNSLNNELSLLKKFDDKLTDFSFKAYEIEENANEMKPENTRNYELTKLKKEANNLQKDFDDFDKSKFRSIEKEVDKIKKSQEKSFDNKNIIEDLKEFENNKTRVRILVSGITALAAVMIGISLQFAGISALFVVLAIPVSLLIENVAISIFMKPKPEIAEAAQKPTQTTLNNNVKEKSHRKEKSEEKAVKNAAALGGKLSKA